MDDHAAMTLGSLYNRLRLELENDLYPPGRRVQVSVASFCIVRDHHHAIAILLDEELYASAFALTRPLYEAAVKGMWLAHCATESDAEKYATGKELREINDLVDELLRSRLPALVSDQLKVIKRRYWKALSSLTHAGHAQVKRWLTPDGVGPKYTKVEVNEIANFTAFVAVVSALERARLGQNEKAIANITSLLPVVESDQT